MSRIYILYCYAIPFHLDVSFMSTCLNYIPNYYFLILSVYLKISFKTHESWLLSFGWVHCLSVLVGVSCDACMKGNFRGKRYKCLICYDYDLCANCYDSGATTSRHTTDHPMQCILTRTDIGQYHKICINICCVMWYFVYVWALCCSVCPSHIHVHCLFHCN